MSFCHRQILLVFFCSFSFLCGPVQGQLFGPRQIGREAGLGATNRRAILSDIEAYIQGARPASGFVGAGNASTAVFAGGQQAAEAAANTQATSSVAGLREESVPPVNQPRRRRQAGIYLERLTPDFESPVDKGPSVALRAPVSHRLQSLADAYNFTVTRSSNPRIATIRGTVPSAKAKRIAELLVLFEPGIETVVNELHVWPTSDE